MAVIKRRYTVKARRFPRGVIETEAPNKAAAKYSTRHGLRQGTKVRVLGKQGRWIGFRVGRHPRMLKTLGVL